MQLEANLLSREWTILHKGMTSYADYTKQVQLLEGR